MKIGIAFLLMCLLAVAVTAQSDYLIAYNVLVDGEKDDYDVFVMKTDGSGRRNVTNNPDVAWTYYAYKDRIFFISDRDTCKRCYYLYSMESDGTGVRKISNLRLEDSWMSARNDGSQIVVTGRTSSINRRQLFLIDVESGNFEQLTHEAGAMHRDPLFSPDGKQIVFAYKPDASDRTVYDDLYIMDTDGKNRKRLTRYPMNDKTSKWHNYHAGPPRWNRKENFITYQSVQNGKSSLYAVTPDGKKQWKLTENRLNEGWHDWSPDGKWLAIEMYDDKNTEFGIYLMNWKTKKVKKLTDPKDSKYQQAPVFVQK
ncbi:MAG: hypothetical protein HKN33_09260 [Pyrinomonadaceae bacterium]|nr:hypothetical protein [Pyrinomonadaceae bacterium]